MVNVILFVLIKRFVGVFLTRKKHTLRCRSIGCQIKFT